MTQFPELTQVDQTAAEGLGEQPGPSLLDHFRQSTAANFLRIGASGLAFLGAAEGISLLTASSAVEASPFAVDAVICDPSNPAVSTKCETPKPILRKACAEDIQARLVGTPTDRANEEGVDLTFLSRDNTTGQDQFKFSAQEAPMPQCQRAGMRTASVVELARIGLTGPFEPISNTVTFKSDRELYLKGVLTLNPLFCTTPAESGTATEIRVTNKWEPKPGWGDPHVKKTKVFTTPPTQFCP